MGHATEQELDKNGRLLLPQVLRHYAGLQKLVMLVGQGKKFEIWAEARWNNERAIWLDKPMASEELPSEIQLLSL